jgi:rhomboid protease GluP
MKNPVYESAYPYEQPKNIYSAKLRHIIPTFLIIAFSTVLGLALLRWLLCIQFSILEIKEEVWVLWLPLILPWIPITLWMRQRLRVLTFKKEEDKRRFFYQIICWLTLTPMLLVSQAYITTATGKLQILSNVNDIDHVAKARYYKLAKFEVAPDYGGVYTYFNTSGKYNQDLNFDIFFVAPIVHDTAERMNPIPKHWYGVKYHQQISNRLSSEEKDEKYKAFYSECVEKMNAYDFQALDHFERMPASADQGHFLKAIEARTKQPVDASYAILTPIQESYDKRNGNKLAWIFGSFGIGFSVLLFALIFPGFSEAERQGFLQGKKPAQDDLVDMLKYLVPTGNHFVTSIIIDLNILVFIVMILGGIDIISPNAGELLEWGGNRRAETTGGEWWRLLTSMFLHGGIMHLISNIFGLVLAAIFVEFRLGRKNYIILYLLAGLCGSLASIWWHTNTVSVGASGAIFGLYGAILGLLLTKAFANNEKKAVLAMIGVYVVINLVWGLTGGIDNAAHIGGLITGAILGIILYKISDPEIEDAALYLKDS